MRNVYKSTLSILVLSCLMLNINILHSQSNWNTYQTTTQLNIEYSDPIVCNQSNGDIQSEYIFLKITNLTNSPINISYRLDTYYIGSGCSTCSNDEYKFSLTIPANGFITTDCEFKISGLSKLAVFKKYLNRTNHKEFEKFEITNIVIL